VIFVTVGSMFPFERMIRIMDDWASRHPEEEIFAQIGGGKYEPRHMRWQRMVAPDAYKKLVRSCRFIVAHAGTGSVFTASEFGKPIVLIPRRAANKEHTTDHQLDTAEWLQGKPGIFVVWSEQELEEGMARAELAVNNIQLLLPPSAPKPFLARIRNFLVA
jgi:UDP-N-acetylglucosamine transferase subunit ALG13